MENPKVFRDIMFEGNTGRPMTQEEKDWFAQDRTRESASDKTARWLVVAGGFGGAALLSLVIFDVLPFERAALAVPLFALLCVGFAGVACIKDANYKSRRP